MNLLEAPFRSPVRILELPGVPEEARAVLAQLGVDAGEVIEKIQAAPLGDPISLRIGQQLFSLRKEMCRLIIVELV